MQYKTIVMELLEQSTELHDQLQREHRLLAAVEALAVRLKASHDEITKQLEQAQPGTEFNDNCFRAMELAIHALQMHLDRLSGKAAPEEHESPSLDPIMAQIIQHSSPE